MQWNEFKSHLRHLSATDQKRVQQAFELGKEAHKGQKRHSGEAFFTHPIAAAHILANMGADVDTLIAALLHDTIEDTDLTLKHIDKLFNGDVAALIDGVTKLEPEDVADIPTLDDQIETLRKTFGLIDNDVRVIVIKLVDRLHNMQTIEHLSKARQKTMAKETLDVYVKIADRLCMQDIRDELEGLCIGVLHPQELEKLNALQERNEHKSVRAIRMLKEKLEEKHLAIVKNVRMTFEKMSWGKLRVQQNVGERTATGVPDMVVEFVCKDVASCYATLGALHVTHPRETLSFQDFINAPMINGYRGLHTTIILEKGTRMRCKIRTEEMHQYAHHGITTLCFDDAAVGVSDYLLPWTEHIAPLSKDTATRSNDFWNSLQHDILGDSIVVHGSDDSHVLVPAGSTALDGAFYCFGKQALKVTSISMDGMDVSFNTPLHNAVSLSMETGTQKTVHRRWLQWVETGLALAQIRGALSTDSHAHKIQVGREIFDQVLQKNRKGLLAEFDESSFQQGLESINFFTFDEACIAIAEGRVQPEEVFAALFTSSKTHSTQRRCNRIHFSAQRKNISTFRELFDTYRVRMFRIRNKPSSSLCTFTIFTQLSSSERDAVEKKLIANDAHEVEISTYHRYLFKISALPVLSILWGLDCLFGKVIITAGVSPYDLTTLRFTALMAMSFIYLSLQKASKKELTKFKLIVPFRKELFISGVAIFVTALSSYITIQTISALTYALCMNIGVGAVVFWQQWRSKTRSTPLLLTSLMFVLTTLLLLYYETGSLLTIAALTGMGCGIGFVVYSLSSKRYQVKESIQYRYPILVIYIAFLALLLSLPHAITSQFTLWNSPMLLPSLAFVILLTAVPYIIYFELLKDTKVKFAWSYIPLFLVVITLGELLIYQTQTWLLLIPLALAAAWQLFYPTTKSYLPLPLSPFRFLRSAKKR